MGKKTCVSEMAVEVGYPLVVLDAIPRNLGVSPYNRDGALFPFPLGVLLAPSRGWEDATGMMFARLEQWLCSVLPFLDTWS